MEWVAEYVLFLLKAATIVAAIWIALMGLASVVVRTRARGRERLQVRHMNQHYRQMAHRLEAAMLSGRDLRKRLRAWHREPPYAGDSPRRRVFVLDFHGDVRASAVDSLRESITAVLTVATPKDEVVLRLESLGGVVAPYGLAASQLVRLREREIPLTVCVDTVAASGGYMMACVANRLLAAPFAVVGSIGVVGQLPNFHRLLKKHEIDYELFKAGDYKRTVSLFGENTDEGRRHYQGKVDDTHALFKEFVARYRPQLNLTQVATGDYWYGSRALELQLVDGLETSDDYLLAASREAELYEVEWSGGRRWSWMRG
jgi:serine protease SohB